MSRKSSLESLLFISNRPLTVRKLSELSGMSDEEVARALKELQDEYEVRKGGMRVIVVGNAYQMTTSSDHAELIKKFLKEEQLAELTKPGLETLAIIAYRGPISKPELEEIRGVNCSLILRNLLIRGLVEKIEDKTKLLPRFQVTHDFLRYLGVSSVANLPEYEKLSHDPNLEKLLQKVDAPQTD